MTNKDAWETRMLASASKSELCGEMENNGLDGNASDGAKGKLL